MNLLSFASVVFMLITMIGALFTFVLELNRWDNTKMLHNVVLAILGSLSWVMILKIVDRWGGDVASPVDAVRDMFFMMLILHRCISSGYVVYSNPHDYTGQDE